MIKKLDSILLSSNVVDNFYKEYNGEFQNWILGILPELEDCKNRNQDTPWHIYSVLDHILHSVEEMNKQTEHLDNNVRRMLAYIMFLHDILSIASRGTALIAIILPCFVSIPSTGLWHITSLGIL